MANNVVIKGFNAVWKLVTRGYSAETVAGKHIKICRVYSNPHICIDIDDSDLIKISAK